MKIIRQSYLIAASPAEVWRALTDPEMIAEWSGADAVFEPTVGAEYELWDGSFCGEIVEAIPNQKLVQTWQPDYWETEDSVVTFTLTPVGHKTRVALLHENVEAFDYEGTKEGWELYYLGAIKQMLEERNAKPAQKARTAKKPKSTPKKKTLKKK
jgi:uncharacterized protein YndB with AHSA1/START domain